MVLASWFHCSGPPSGVVQILRELPSRWHTKTKFISRMLGEMDTRVENPRKDKGPKPSLPLHPHFLGQDILLFHWYSMLQSLITKGPPVLKDLVTRFSPPMSKVVVEEAGPQWGMREVRGNSEEHSIKRREFWKGRKTPQYQVWRGVKKDGD